MSLRKISDRLQIALPSEAAKACHCQVGDYVEVIVKNGLIILKPVSIIDRDQEYFYTKSFKESLSFYKSCREIAGRRRC